ncbi:hypothetical protein C8J56DRAFT_951620 [Mycena floridula]|nr:hypothetical protein C8J56DRAFT_951620 [Mycena floridula]
MRTPIFFQALLRFWPFRSSKVHIYNSQYLPDDILLQISVVLNAASPVDALQMAVTSRRMFRLIIPVIYSSTSFRCNNHCRQGLKFLLKHPYIVSYIRKLTIRCNTPLWGRKTDLRRLDESKFIKELEKLLPELMNLDTFIWQGKQMPEQDNFWSKLRQSCPSLRHLGIIVRQPKCGHAEPEILADSQVFAFRGLVSFTVVIRRSYKGGYFSSPPRTYPLPAMFWEFLRQNTDLEELNIETYNFYEHFQSLADIGPLFQLQFPRLRKFSMGDFEQIIPGPPGGWILAHRHLPDALTLHTQFNNFLSNHLSLQWVYTRLHSWAPSWPLLPNLTHLRCDTPMIGVHDPSILTSLEVLGVWWEFYPTAAFPNLRELAICLRGQTYRVLSTLRERNPNLHHIDISCDRWSTQGISLEAFSALSLPEHLTTLRITTPHSNNSMQVHALSIFRHVASLQSLTMRYMTRAGYFDTHKGYLRVGQFHRVSRYPAMIIAGHEVFISEKGKRESLRYRSAVVPRV